MQEFLQTNLAGLAVDNMEALRDNNTKSNAGTAVLSEDKTKAGDSIPGKAVCSFETGQSVPSLSGSEGNEGQSQGGDITVEFPPGGLDKAEDIGPMNIGSCMRDYASAGGTGSFSENKETKRTPASDRT